MNDKSVKKKHSSLFKQEKERAGYSDKKKAVAKKMGKSDTGPMEWSKMTSQQKKNWLDIDKSVAKKKYYTNVQGIRMEDKRDATMRALDRQKAKRLY